MGMWQDYDEDFDEEDRRPAPRCNRCGDTDVRWRQQGGKWVLFSLRPGVEHRCPVSDGAFPDLTK